MNYKRLNRINMIIYSTYLKNFKDIKPNSCSFDEKWYKIKCIFENWESKIFEAMVWSEPWNIIEKWNDVDSIKEFLRTNKDKEISKIFKKNMHIKYIVEYDGVEHYKILERSE